MSDRHEKKAKTGSTRSHHAGHHKDHHRKKKKEVVPAYSETGKPASTSSSGKKSCTIPCTNESGQKVKINVHQVKLNQVDAGGRAVQGVAIRVTLPGELRDPMEKTFTMGEAQALQQALEKVIG